MPGTQEALVNFYPSLLIRVSVLGGIKDKTEISILRRHIIQLACFPSVATDSGYEQGCPPCSVSLWRLQTP